MIRKLNKKDINILTTYLKQSPAINIFMIGDLENFGIETGFQTYWGEFNENGSLIAVMLRYYKGFNMYSRADFDVEGFTEIMMTYDHDVLSGDVKILEKFEPYLKNYEIRDCYFAEIKTAPIVTDEKGIQIANASDAPKIAQMENKIEEFRKVPINERIQQLEKKITTKAGRVYYIEEEGDILSAASSTAENSVSAMIVGVATVKTARNKGYVTKIMKKLVADLLKEKESVCLFYDNPNAGEIYKKIGFEDVAKWRMYVKKRCKHERI